MQPRQRGFPPRPRAGQFLEPLRRLTIQPSRVDKGLVNRMITRSTLQCFVTLIRGRGAVGLVLSISAQRARGSPLALPAAEGREDATAQDW